MYVPFEAQYRKNEVTGKEVVVGHGPGAHIKRLLSEGAMYTNAPGMPAPEQTPELAATEAQLRAELEQAKAEREQFMKELMEIRAKMEADQGVPNAAKRK